jgi:uncharacterized protein YjdB
MRHFKKIDWSISLSLLLACVLTVVAACVESSGPLGAPNVVVEGPAVSAVQITLAQSTLVPGQTTQATAVATSADGKVVGGPVNYSSQNASIATVSSKGLVTAVAAGIAVIQATAGGCAATASVTVNSLASRVAVVAVALDSTSLGVGHSARARATVTDSAGTAIIGDTISWTSLAPTVATVSSIGTVTAIAPGSATIQGTVDGTIGSASITVLQGSSSVATVAVAIDSITLLVGHVAHAVATAKDASGTTILAATVTWTSLTPGLATVSSSGAVTAVAEGPAAIQATISGVAGVDTIVAVVAPDLASQDFDAGSVTPYVNFWDPAVGGNGEVDVVNDPTGAGKRKVARMHYVGTNQDRNRFLQFTRHTGFGETIYSRGEFYLDAADLGTGFVGRKLIYYRPNQPLTKYGGAWREFGSITGMQGNGLYINNFYVPVSGNVIERVARIADILPRTWYTLETQMTPETSIGAGNGIFRVWLNGALIYSITDLKLSDPAWIGIPIPGGNSTPYELADCYLERVEVGEQVNYNIGSFDEYRYWDKVAFSTKRIGQ